jgi:hypothetical protein
MDLDTNDVTHVGMSPELFDDRVIKVAGVTQEGAGNVVCVFQALEHIINNWYLRPLLEFDPGTLCGEVKVMNPGMMGRSVLVPDVILELYNV